MRVKCLTYENRLDAETSALTMRPPSHMNGFRKLQVSGIFDAILITRNLCDKSRSLVFRCNIRLSVQNLKDNLKF